RAAAGRWLPGHDNSRDHRRGAARISRISRAAALAAAATLGPGGPAGVAALGAAARWRRRPLAGGRGALPRGGLERRGPSFQRLAARRTLHRQRLPEQHLAV